MAGMGSSGSLRIRGQFDTQDKGTQSPSKTSVIMVIHNSIITSLVILLPLGSALFEAGQVRYHVN